LLALRELLSRSSLQRVSFATTVTHLVMFDIDGTLVDSMGFDAQLYAIDETWLSYRNVTDSGILEEILAQRDFGRPVDELGPRIQRRFVALVRDYLAANVNTLREIPGAKALVETLLATPGVRVAIATGGWAETALMKLRAIGMPVDALAVATSSDARERTRIMQIAERRALAGAAPRRRTYFGDAPWDQRASRELGFEFVAIGTSVEHEPRFDDYTNRDAVLTRVLGESGASAG
jgi:phosphoglycolate phosphatase-like HAD superfamily hydrolase